MSIARALSSSRRPVPRALGALLAVTASAALVAGSVAVPSAEAATPRVGGTCTRAGATNARPALTCVARTVGGRRVLRWAATPASTTTAPAAPGATTTRPVGAAPAAGPCPDGRWKAGPAEMSAFVAAATVVPPPTPS